MKAGLWNYLKAAFNARPMGMFVPPNWVGLALFGMLGAFVLPGFWLLGAGLELAYLYSLAFNPRFRKLVDAKASGSVLEREGDRAKALLAPLSAEDRAKYVELTARCTGILEQQAHTQAPKEAVDAQRAGLERLLWIYLKLLLTRQAIVRVVDQDDRRGEASRDLERRVADLEKRLKEPALDEDLKKSLTSQVDILKQRLEARAAARQKHAFLEAELTRIVEQVELIREQSALNTDPESVSQRIDQVTSTLGGTNQWIKEQREIFGEVENILDEAPPITLNVPEGAN